MDELLNITDVARILKIPTSTVYRMTRNKELPAFKVGKHWRYKRHELEKWIVEQGGVDNEPAKV